MMKMTPSDSLWPPAPRQLELPPDEVHVWRADLDAAAPSARSLSTLLSLDETARAQRFRFATDRDRFIARRGLLRVLLGTYLHQDPSQVRFVYDANGRPALAGDPGEDHPSFSLTHSRGLALYAITSRRAVGVDVEYHRINTDCLKIAEQFFSAREVEALQGRADGSQVRDFFALWTCKEACLKALGTGLSLPLDQVEVDLGEAGFPVLRSLQGDPHEAAEWSLRQLVAKPDYSAALAVRGHDWKLRCWDWTHRSGTSRWGAPAGR